MTKHNHHVVPHPDGWAVKRAGGNRVSLVHDTQQQAIDRAREGARKQGSELLVHNRKGQIRERDSYGPDPFPPRDKR
ncbi:DUF2188 domain-containing protein [Skermanella mucosa]|uniref:DUF2188 domain-containing protein n=1 Tax=Skermanella mucosa TaxID=1789672 RepID=UPI00192BF34F|nr:DUF2188 domain-containing protein [Skermanella mucosa]UEM21281.1 DUF2188 domain-containing protein [Skermanella mucosa]